MIEENKKIIIDTEVDINEDLIKILLENHSKIVKSRFKKLDNYYKGKHDILNRSMDDPQKPNNKIVTNFCSYIVDVKTGFFMGKPVEYKSENKPYLVEITNIMARNDEDTENYTLAHKSSIKGQSFELVYMDENAEVCFKWLDTDGTIIAYDNTINQDIIFAIRYYDVANILDEKDITTYIEVYTKECIKKYTKKEDTITFIEEIAHHFKEVPIIEYANDRFRKSDIENIITLQDAYNLNTADISNDIEYFSNAYLVLEGMEDTEDSDVANIKQDRMLILPQNGKAKFLTKEINDTVVQNHRENLKEDIHKMSYVPDLSKEINSNVSGTAIKQKFFTTYQSIANKERMFKKGLLKRLRLITNILNTKGNSYLPVEMEIQFNKNIPINMVEYADSAIKLMGVLPQQMVIEELNKQGLEINVDRAMSLVKETMESNIYDNSIPDVEGDSTE